MTPNKEDFIKTIYELGGDTQVVNNKSLVQALDVSAASVTDMNSRLLKEKLITHTPYRGVQLSEIGIKIANQLIRKHRLWEVFLAEKLGYEWNEVHSDADLLEHASSDTLIERLDAYLSYPKFDPHGGSIPTQGGTMNQASHHSLIEYQTGDSIRIKQVEDQEEFLQYLSSKQIQLDNEYVISGMEPFEGPITLVDAKQNEVLISYKAAFKISVAHINE